MQIFARLRSRVDTARAVLILTLLLASFELSGQDSLDQRGFTGRVQKIVHYSSVSVDPLFGTQFRLNTVTIDEDTYDQNGNRIDHDSRFVGKERWYVFNESGQRIQECLLYEDKPVFKTTYEYSPSGGIVRERCHSLSTTGTGG